MITTVWFKRQEPCRIKSQLSIFCLLIVSFSPSPLSFSVSALPPCMFSSMIFLLSLLPCCTSSKRGHISRLSWILLVCDLKIIPKAKNSPPLPLPSPLTTTTAAGTLISLKQPAEIVISISSSIMMIQYIWRGSEVWCTFFFFHPVSRTGLRVGPSAVFVRFWHMSTTLQRGFTVLNLVWIKSKFTLNKTHRLAALYIHDTNRKAEGHGYVILGFITRGSQFSEFILQCVFSQKQFSLSPRHCLCVCWLITFKGHKEETNCSHLWGSLIEYSWSSLLLQRIPTPSSSFPLQLYNFLNHVSTSWLQSHVQE